MTDDVFYKDLDIRWGDQDNMGHVNNAVFSTYFEEARAYFFEQVDIFIHKPLYPQQGPIMAALELQFKQQLSWPARVRVLVRTVKIGNSSFHLSHELYSQADELVCTGKAVIVWFHYGEQRSAPLPDSIRNKLKSKY